MSQRLFHARRHPLLVDPLTNHLPAGGSCAILGRLYQETRMQMTHTTYRFSPAAASAAAMSDGLGPADARGAIRSIPALAGRLVR